MICERDGDSIIVLDTRSVAVAKRIPLQGVRKDVIEFCDKAQNIEQIYERFKTEKGMDVPRGEIKVILEELMNDKLMIKEGAWYLSLPIMPQLA